MAAARIESTPDGLAFYTPYDPTLVAEFKSRIPAADRRWDGPNKRWLVAAGRLPVLEQLCDRFGLAVVKNLRPGYDVAVPVQRIRQVRYIGAPKEREDGSITASGYADGEWSIVFPQDVLRAWFDAPAATPSAAATFYGLLGIKRDATDDDIKRAHRLMVKRWHPDVNRDPDAGEMMKRINAAYAVLSNTKLRGRYDAGLILESMTAPAAPSLRPPATAYWRPPLRCGWLLLEGTERLGRLHVTAILQWQDITDAAGRVLVTSWPLGADTFQEQWI